jgi:soluble lytic murein transglycosylase
MPISKNSSRLTQTCVLAALAFWLGVPSPAALAETASDAVIQEMAQAYRKADRKTLTSLLPAAKGHLLEPWAAYWELSARLPSASNDEFQTFFKRYAGTYQEDRLRNDLLLQLGKRQDWTGFEKFHPTYRMNDDPQVKCYALVVQAQREQVPVHEQVLDTWMAQKDGDEGCTLAVAQQILAGKIKAPMVWQRARLGMEQGRPRVVQTALQILNAEWADTAAKIFVQPEGYLDGKLIALRPRTRELVTLALIRLAQTDVAAAREQMDKLRWRTQLTPEERSWIWAVIGKQSALNLSSDALTDFAKAQDHRMTDDHLAWKARAALRVRNWSVLLSAITFMSAAQQAEPVWVYWRAIALQQPEAEARAKATELLRTIAGPVGFYEQLALEELGQSITLPAAPLIDPQDLELARKNPGLQRALAAIAMGLRSEGVREWNYSTNLHDKGGLPDRQLRAAAQLACEQQVWDRCINASDRTRQVVDVAQRYPMPLKNAVTSRSREIALDPAYVYGLMRQESRFIMTARSGVGASGLMQIMPATARWTAQKIGMTHFTLDQLNNETINIALGTSYLKLVLDEFEGHMAMAAGAYNAGPSRVRFWRIGPSLDAAIWIENIPFGETRDYVKKVLANTTVYAALISGQPQSLKARLPTVGPRQSGSPVADANLP